MSRSRAVPILLKDGTRRPLEPALLGDGQHDEAWLQALIHNHPEIVPITDIEPGFGDLIPVAREVPTRHGVIDNLFLTPAGDIVIAETKLWRNPEMRRKVVAQALDYVAALTSMDYQTLEQAVARGAGGPRQIYDIVRSHPEALDEARFVDAVARNLRRGRMVAMVLGDGIRSETEALAGLLQSHAGAHFTFALVELATWQSDAGDILVVPSVLAKTVMIERGIVRIAEGIPTVHPVPRTASAKPQSLSMEDFWAALAERNPSWPAAVRELLTALEPLGVYGDLTRTLSLKLDLPDWDRPINFGYFMRNGQFWPSTLMTNTPEAVWRPYFETLAALVGGQVIKSPGNDYVAVTGRRAPNVGHLLPQHQEAWVAAIEQAIRTLEVERVVSN